MVAASTVISFDRGRCRPGPSFIYAGCQQTPPPWLRTARPEVIAIIRRGTYSDGSGFCYGTVYNFRYGSPNTTDYFVIKDLETRYTMLAVFQGRAKNASLDQSDSRFKALKPRLDKIIENPRVRFWIYFDIDNKITAVELMTYSGDF